METVGQTSGCLSNRCLEFMAGESKEWLVTFSRSQDTSLYTHIFRIWTLWAAYGMKSFLSVVARLQAPNHCQHSP